MARYIDDILQPGERVLFTSNLHWVVFTRAMMAWAGAVALLVLTRLMMNDSVVLFLLACAAVLTLAGLYWFIIAWFRRWTTETDVTNLRVVHKTGFITRQTFEISIDKIAGVKVAQSIMGRILNYGDINLESMGDQDKNLKLISSPLKFRNSITAR